MIDKLPLPFSKPTISEEAIAEVVATLRSGWITTGPRVKKFEEMLADYFGVPHGQVFACSSATAAMHIALLLLNLKPGDEVITSAMTFAATVNVIVQCGAIPRFVDIDDTYNMNVDQLKKAINKKTRAIMPVHFTGHAADLDPVYELARQYNCRVIEDAAQAIGAGYKGHRLGAKGDMQAFSFHPNKNMTTGEGGCLVVHDDQRLDEITQWRFRGIDRRDAWNRFSKSGSQNYQVVRPGYKYTMMDMQAALGIHQLPELEAFNKKRTELAMRYYELFEGWKELQLPVRPVYDNQHSWHLFAPLILPAAGMSRDEFMASMKEENIMLGLHYGCASHLYEYCQRDYGYKEGDFPVAERVANSIVSLPLFPTMTHAEQDRVVETMAKIFKKDF